MLRPEHDPDECQTCTTCPACGLGIHSCCRPVPCHHNGRYHACNCMSHLHEAAS